MLDVRFSRRWYATLFAALAGALVFIAIMNLDHLVVLGVALVLGSCSAILSTTALGGWLSSVCRKSEENKLSAWFNLAYICATGLTMIVAGELIRHLPVWMAAAILAAIVFLPPRSSSSFPLPAGSQTGRRELHPVHARDPHSRAAAGSIDRIAPLPHALRDHSALTNLLGGIGNDFSASPRMVSLAGGAATMSPASSAACSFRFSPGGCRCGFSISPTEPWVASLP